MTNLDINISATDLNLVLQPIAVLFFAICTVFELFCVFLYAFISPKLPIVKYYRAKAASEGSKTVSADLAAGCIHSHPVQEVSSALHFFNTNADREHDVDEVHDQSTIGTNAG